MLMDIFDVSLTLLNMPQHLFRSIKCPFFVPRKKKQKSAKVLFIATWCFPNCSPMFSPVSLLVCLDILDIFLNTARHPQCLLNVAQFPYHLKKFLNSPPRFFDAARHEV
jgi:hypothetical protein